LDVKRQTAQENLDVDVSLKDLTDDMRNVINA
jgi:hypothetical protein